MARQEITQIDFNKNLAVAKANLLENAQSVNLKSYVSQHPIITLTGTFFAGIVIGGSISMQAQLAQMTVSSLKKEVLKQLLDL